MGYSPKPKPSYPGPNCHGGYYGGKGGKGSKGGQCELVCDKCHDVWVPYGGKGGKGSGKGKGGKGGYYYSGYYGYDNKYGPSYRNLEGEEEIVEEGRDLAGYPTYSAPTYGQGYGSYGGKGGKGGKGSNGCGKGSGACGYWETICEPQYQPIVGGKGGKGGKGYYNPSTPLYPDPFYPPAKCDSSPYCYGNNCCTDPCFGRGGKGSKGGAGCGYYGGKGGKGGYYSGGYYNGGYYGGKGGKGGYYSYYSGNTQKYGRGPYWQ